MEFKRSAGVLLPMFSLHSRYGIGTMGKAAYDFIDFLAQTGQSWWQMLPVETTGYGNSPYYCMDAFESNPLFIDLDMLIEDGLLERADVEAIDWGEDPSRVDYDKVWEGRKKLFEKFSREQLQEIFAAQWKAMREYAHSKGVGLIGDLPIYVPAESVDVKNNPQEFQLDENGVPKAVAGVPPDGFSADGQLWGNALYDWTAMKKNGYNWWIRRVGRAASLFDMVRIDHFRGFAQYWSIPYGETTAKNGHWEDGPGIDFVKTIINWYSDTQFIAEDLGVITQDVGTLLKESGLPGMKVLEFAFDPDYDSDFLPHAYPDDNCICYIGTHDNCTAKEWVEIDAPQKCLDFAKLYLHITDDEGMIWGLIRGGMGSVAKLFVAQMQDYLELGAEARINRPGTVGGNWEWRITKDQLAQAPAERILEITKRYGRAPKKPKESAPAKE